MSHEQDLRAVLDWFISDSHCDVWNGHFIEALRLTPEPLRSMVRREINAYRAKHEKDPL